MRRLLLLLLLAGCSSHSPGPLQPPVVVHGVLRMTGGPSGASSPGVQGRVIIVGPGPHGATLSTPTKADGSFVADLIPGTYRVTGHSPLYGSDQGVCRADGDVVVRSGANDPITVSCSRK